VALPTAVLLDFSGTLFHVETTAEAVRAALGPDYLGAVPALELTGAVPGSAEPADVPAHLAPAWEQRDLSAQAHRAAYRGLALHAGLDEAAADRLYERVTVDPRSWQPYLDTGEVLRRLHEAAVPVALVSNIGWDLRPVLAEHGVSEHLPVLVLSDERGIVKPDREIFRQACAALGVDPSADVVMVGDNRLADGGAVAAGLSYSWVSPSPDRAPDALLRALGLV